MTAKGITVQNETFICSKIVILGVFWLNSTSIIFTGTETDKSITQNQRTQAQSVGNASFLVDETEISDEEIEESER